MTTDNQRLLQYSLYGLALVLGYLLWRTFDGLLGVVDEFYFPVLSAELPVLGSIANLIPLLSLIAALGAAEYARRHPVTNRFGVEVVSELRKVTWPSYKDVRGTTLVVGGVTLVISLVLLLFDKTFEGLITLVFKLL